jgi:hypothetical protein
MNFANITLGELLSNQNETIKRNAFSILKQLQKERDKEKKCNCGRVASLGELGHHDDCAIYQ